MLANVDRRTVPVRVPLRTAASISQWPLSRGPWLEGPTSGTAAARPRGHFESNRPMQGDSKRHARAGHVLTDRQVADRLTDEAPPGRPPIGPVGLCHVQIAAWICGRKRVFRRLGAHELASGYWASAARPALGWSRPRKLRRSQPCFTLRVFVGVLRFLRDRSKASSPSLGPAPAKTCSGAQPFLSPGSPRDLVTP